MAFELPKLPFEKNGLEPFISEETIMYHYGKHHQAYVNNLNNLILGTELENKSIEEIIKEAEGGIFNNAAQVWNHTFYFFQFNRNGEHSPIGNVKKAIEKKWGTIDEFISEFSKAAATLFGSGWAWLVKNEVGELQIIQTQNAENPLTQNFKPILTCDVWEHAYYIDKQNARPEYIKDFWKIIDWEVIEKRW